MFIRIVFLLLNYPFFSAISPAVFKAYLTHDGVQLKVN